MQLPIKTIVGNIQTIYNGTRWSDPSNTLTNNKFYRWIVVLTITPKRQSSLETNTPKRYDGLDLKVGSWFADSTGKAYKIVSFTEQTATNVTLTCEDVDFYNAINDTTTAFNGIPKSGNCVFFDISELGVPQIEGVSSLTYNPASIATLNTRFFTYNPNINFVNIKQTNHGLNVGDIVAINTDTGLYDLATSSDFAVGIVTMINNPSNDYFSFEPFGKIDDSIKTPLIGEMGDIFYLDPANPGKLTKEKPVGKNKPIYIRLESETKAILLDTISDTVATIITYEMETVTQDQIEFELPTDAVRVLEMSINGIENKNFTFDVSTHKVTFDPVKTGYNVDPEDIVIFTYETFN